MMSSVTYLSRREELETYFDRTAAEAWARLTSEAPVSGIRATVRAGRDRMRALLLSWLPQDMRGLRLLDAGCGTGALAVEAARRGAQVTATDLSSTLIGLARERAPRDLGEGGIEFVVGDMTETKWRKFDYTVGMDSLIHYRAPDMARVVTALAESTERAVLFTFAPRTAMLSTMHAVGRLFPRGDSAPAIEPIGVSSLSKRLAAEPALTGWVQGRSERISSGFYISQALEMVRA
jgi:magnesium-protoporphyrin O-methyltransferase